MFESRAKLRKRIEALERQRDDALDILYEIRTSEAEPCKSGQCELCIFYTNTVAGTSAARNSVPEHNMKRRHGGNRLLQ